MISIMEDHGGEYMRLPRPPTPKQMSCQHWGGSLLAEPELRKYKGTILGPRCANTLKVSIFTHSYFRPTLHFYLIKSP